jgi:hypothetical protein
MQSQACISCLIAHRYHTHTISYRSSWIRTRHSQRGAWSFHLAPNQPTLPKPPLSRPHVLSYFFRNLRYQIPQASFPHDDDQRNEKTMGAGNKLPEGRTERTMVDERFSPVLIIIGLPCSLLLSLLKACGTEPCHILPYRIVLYHAKIGMELRAR